MCGEVSWLPPSCESRVGAAHRRQGTPCQDASGLWCFTDADGQPLQALVVSDGHGSARYDRSAVGSKLACEVALKAIESQLAKSPIGGPSDVEPWRVWLAHGLPDAVLQGWRRDVLHHGQDEGGRFQITGANQCPALVGAPETGVGHVGADQGGPPTELPMSMGCKPLAHLFGGDLDQPQPSGRSRDERSPSLSCALHHSSSGA